MGGWVWHQQDDREPPEQVHGIGYSLSDKDEPGKEFSLDAKTGLLLPPAAARERRKVKTGFQHQAEEAI